VTPSSLPAVRDGLLAVGDAVALLLRLQHDAAEHSSAGHAPLRERQTPHRPQFGITLPLHRLQSGIGVSVLSLA
jgi:hypothetical protein